LIGGVKASRIFPMICIQSCNVAQVSLHALWGRAGQASGKRVGALLSVNGMAPRNDYQYPLEMYLLTSVRVRDGQF
jgi:hypothetical protein